MLRFLQQAVRTGKASLVYESGEIRQFVQEKCIWCTDCLPAKIWVKKRGPYMRIGVSFCALSVWEFAKVLIINGCGPGVCPH